MLGSAYFAGGVLVALAFLLAALALAVQFAPLPHPRLSKFAAACCYTVAAVIATGLVLPKLWFFVVAVPVGTVAALGYGALLARAWRSEGRAAISGPPRPTPVVAAPARPLGPGEDSVSATVTRVTSSGIVSPPPFVTTGSSDRFLGPGITEVVRAVRFDPPLGVTVKRGDEPVTLRCRTRRYGREKPALTVDAFVGYGVRIREHVSGLTVSYTLYPEDAPAEAKPAAATAATEPAADTTVERPSPEDDRFGDLGALCIEADAILSSMAMELQGSPRNPDATDHPEVLARWEHRTQEALIRAGVDEMQLAYFNRDTETTLFGPSGDRANQVRQWMAELTVRVDRVHEIVRELRARREFPTLPQDAEFRSRGTVLLQKGFELKGEVFYPRDTTMSGIAEWTQQLARQRTLRDRVGRWAKESRGYLCAVPGGLPGDFLSEEEEDEALDAGEEGRVLNAHLTLLQQVVARLPS